MEDIFNMGEETQDGPERKPCPQCGKEVTWTQAGKPRQHKCVDKPETAKPEPSGIVARVIAKYLEDRDDLDRRTKEFEESLKETQALQEKRLEFLWAELKKAGATSQNTPFGRSEVYKVDSATVADPLIFMQWVRDNEEWGFLENRVSKTAVKQRLSDGKLVPPGVNYTTIEKVKVVRKTG